MPSSELKDFTCNNIIMFARMEGRGVYTDTAGRQWVGMFSGKTAQSLRLKLK